MSGDFQVVQIKHVFHYNNVYYLNTTHSMNRTPQPISRPSARCYTAIHWSSPHQLSFRWARVSSGCGVANRRQFGEVERCGQPLLSSRTAVGPVDP